MIGRAMMRPAERRSDRSPSAPTSRSRCLDVAGSTTRDARYEPDARAVPQPGHRRHRDFPPTIDGTGRSSPSTRTSIGDFTWTGWDYLGEVGIGRVDYTDDEGTRRRDRSRAYPWLTAWCGDIDITGHRRPMLLLPRDRLRPAASSRTSPCTGPSTTAGRLHDAVVLERHGRQLDLGRPGRLPVTVEVYSDADEVELLLDGSPRARRRSGPRNPSSPDSRPATSRASWSPSPAPPDTSTHVPR